MYIIRTDSNGWVRDKKQADTEEEGFIEVSQSDYDTVEPSNPDIEAEVWNWNGGSPELRETGASPSGDEAYAKMEAYLRDKYTLNEWADLLDSNPTLVRLIQNEAYQDAVDRADYLAGQDSSLVDQEDADKLREVTKV